MTLYMTQSRMLHTPYGTYYNLFIYAINLTRRKQPKCPLWVGDDWVPK